MQKKEEMMSKSVITFTGNAQELAAIREKVAGKEGPFDFSSIIPMPDTIRAVAHGGHEDDSLSYYCLSEGKELPPDEYRIMRREDGEPFSLADYHDYITGNPGSISLEEGRILYGNLTQYGCKDWYDWACENWGTPSNASRTSFEMLSRTKMRVVFYTVWLAPFEVIRALSAMFPRILVELEASDGFGMTDCMAYIGGKMVFSWIDPDFDADVCEEDA